ncbi:ABC transporter permease [Photobacterium gaetbulicola]|uniref:ABC transporter permease n=1 Tax=Photobacterium gaetbulicola TaxID=1295392 RepID=UPI0013C36F74|nr:ABC-2 family transporter protein [Photobacterium gaetbulicola]
MLDSIKFHVDLYLSLIAQHIKSKMQYRADFIIGAFSIIVINAVSIVSIWIVFQNVDDIKGWSFAELVFIYSFYLVASSPSQILCENLWTMSSKLVDGSFIKYYTKPVNMLFYYLSETVDLKGLGLLGFGFFGLSYASNEIGIAWSPLNVVALVFLLISASLIIASFMILTSASSFWTRYSFGLMTLSERLKDFSKYPVSILGKPLSVLFSTLLPLAFSAYYPSAYFIRGDEYSFALLLTPIIGVAFFLIAYYIWNLGAQYYEGTGA